MKVAFKRLMPAARMPVYATSGAAGMDLCAAEHSVILPKERRVITTGIAIELPPGYEAQVRARSGLAAKNGLMIVNGVGTIDSDYRGVIGVIIYNSSDVPFSCNPGDRIAQLVIAPVTQIEPVEAATLSESARGANGFGSTGIKS